MHISSLVIKLAISIKPIRTKKKQNIEINPIFCLYAIYTLESIIIKTGPNGLFKAHNDTDNSLIAHPGLLDLQQHCDKTK